MTTDFKAPFLVQSIYSFKGKNNDELCFRKGDIITVTQTEEGGWWEGSLDGKTGWFPSNYVKPYQKDGRSTTSDASQNKCGTLIMDLLMQCKANRVVIVKDLIDSEKAHVTELNNLFNNFLLPIQRSELLKKEEYQQLIGNIEQIVEEHEKLLKGLEEVALQPTEQQRIGRLFLSSAAWFKQIHKAYCASHPRAVLIIDKYKEELGNIMELNGASSPGVLVLTIGLSKPFRRLDKYSGMLQELERYTDECHVDRGDLQRSISVYKDIMSVCAVTRRQKELELEVLRGGVRGWEGDDLSSLGEIVHMGSVAVGPDHTDRYFVLFPTTLLILSISHRMSAFIYEGKLPLTGIHVNNLEDTSNETYRNAFEIVGPMIEKIIAICQTKEDKLMWLEKIRHQISTIRSSSVSFGGGGGGQSPLKCVSPQTSTSSSYHFPSKSSVTTTTTAAPPPTPPHANIPKKTVNEGNEEWNASKLRPSAPIRSYCNERVPRNTGKFCDRSFAEDALILQVIEGYCCNTRSRYTVNSVSTVGNNVGKNSISRSESVKSEARKESPFIGLVEEMKEEIKSLNSKMESLSSHIEEERIARTQLQNFVKNNVPAFAQNLQSTIGYTPN